MKRFALCLAMLAALAPAPVTGVAALQQQKQKQKPSCDEAGTQFEMNQCAHREYLSADAELNKVYKQLVSELDGEELAKLKVAEAAWLKYRDAHCEYESFFNRGGTIRPMIHSFCLARVTGARTEELKQQIETLEQR